MLDFLITKIAPSIKNISKKDKTIYQLIIYQFTYKRLTEYFYGDLSRSKHACTENKGEFMKEGEVIKKIVNELLTTGEYSIKGIAHYTGFHEDVIYDLASGINSDPTITLANKVIELHFLAKRDLYLSIFQDILQIEQR